MSSGPIGIEVQEAPPFVVTCRLPQPPSNPIEELKKVMLYNGRPIWSITVVLFQGVLPPSNVFNNLPVDVTAKPVVLSG